MADDPNLATLKSNLDTGTDAMNVLETSDAKIDKADVEKKKATLDETIKKAKAIFEKLPADKKSDPAYVDVMAQYDALAAKLAGLDALLLEKKTCGLYQ